MVHYYGSKTWAWMDDGWNIIMDQKHEHRWIIFLWIKNMSIDGWYIIMDQKHDITCISTVYMYTWSWMDDKKNKMNKKH